MNNNSDFVWYKHGLGTVAVCMLVAFMMSYLDMFSLFNQAWIDRDIRDNGLLGGVYFILVAGMLTACGAPRQLMAFLGGYAFGFVAGALLSTIATVMGCMLAFFASRLLIRPIIRRKFSRQVVRIDNFLYRNPFRKTMIIRLLPVGSNIMTNLLAGSTAVKPSAFFAGSALGYVPQMVIFALLGKGLFIGSEWKIAVSIALLLISSFLSVSLYKKNRQQGLEVLGPALNEGETINHKNR
ncbi:VTT domain-containing protein [Glaciecola sp. XM2]|uniref:TVP38/TMEM64 family protein n=1 Tax=Glaciecola sp. XM2 TaxID=1914931 RepID=UPI00203308DC|nr:VTT domain-containing protein [Glaciecola sp. XM2]